MKKEKFVKTFILPALMPIFIHFEPLVSRINENLEFHEYKKVQEKEQHFQDMINCPIYILVKEQNNESKKTINSSEQIKAFPMPGTFSVMLANGYIINGIIDEKELEMANKLDRAPKLKVFVFHPADEKMDIKFFELDALFWKQVDFNKSWRIKTISNNIESIFEYCTFKDGNVIVASDNGIKVLGK
ncbi:MAG: hypothetical protein QXS91_02465 [Candidatus Anstonellales archaeon]